MTTADHLPGEGIVDTDDVPARGVPYGRFVRLPMVKVIPEAAGKVKQDLP